jgi:putative thioredoxin
MGVSIVVDSNSFITEVVQRSYQQPVLIDFYATWCGPCQLLKPILEKLSQEYDFVLAKVDIDQNPDLANAYGVQGVPDVRVAAQGEVFEGFVGVLPEPKLREFLAELGLKSSLEIGLDAIQVAKIAGDRNEVNRLFNDLLTHHPSDRRLILEAARYWISQQQIESAEHLLNQVSETDREFFPQVEALRGLIQFHKECAQPVIETELDKQYIAALRAALAEDYATALQQLLQVIQRDRKYRNDQARKAMITLFGLLGDEHTLTRQYRKQLMQALY